MNMPLQRNTNRDPAGEVAELQSETDRLVTLPTTADSDSAPRASLTGDSLHTVSAIYPSRAEAEGVRLQFIESGFGDSALQIISDASESQLWVATNETDGVLRDVLVDGAIGTAVGTGVGVIGAVAIAASSITLFVASPVVAPLAMLGWFAGLGGVIGAAFGANRAAGSDQRKGKLSELVMDAIEEGNTALVVRTHCEAERELAKEIITDSLQGTDQTPARS